MHRIFCIIVGALTCSLLFYVLPVNGQNEQKQKEWTGKRKDATPITTSDLEKILSEHQKWIETDEKEGKRADLRGADLGKATLRGAKLIEADLRGANLSGADLELAKLRGADLGGANLSVANLWGANLDGADLSGATLIEADLRGATLIGADLGKATLRGAKLRGADLGKAKLIEADLDGATLIEADLWRADLSGATLWGADLGKATLIEADLSGATLRGAKLIEADLRGANLSGAYLGKADLRGADLWGAKLIEANLRGANLSGASLYGADLKDCILNSVTQLPLIYEPKAGSPPYIPSIANFPSLSKLTFEKSPHGMVDLREGFKKMGYRRQEREITYAIKHTQRRKLWNYSKKEVNDTEGTKNEKDRQKSIGIWDRFEGLFHLLFFELTCQYGMEPGRPLIILFFAIIPLFSIPYSVVLMRPPKRDGIWKVWISDRVRKDLGSEDPVRLNLGFFSALRFGFYFSLISAFSIGWRELNVGNWMTRIQWREYTLRASGWVRMVSGFQSLVSVYLLAMWVLTYFGRPFEAV